MRTSLGRLATPLVGIALGAALLALELYLGTPAERAAVAAAIIVAWSALLWLLQPRSELVSSVVGRPRDERWELVNLKAAAASVAVTAVLTIVGFAVTELQGGDGTAYGISCGILSFSFVAGVAWYRSRV